MPRAIVKQRQEEEDEEEEGSWIKVRLERQRKTTVRKR